MKIAVIGGGSFGTALAKLLAEIGHNVVIWTRNPEAAESISTLRQNQAYLPDITLPDSLRVTSSMEEAVSGREMLVAMGPSHVMRELMGKAVKFVRNQPYLVSAAKGIEDGSNKRMSEVLRDVFGNGSEKRISALSGPSFAREIAQGMPTAVTAASQSEETAEVVQSVFRAPHFRVYSSTDLLGVEIGGAAKNVIAIAAGVCDGLNLGSSARAALITRGVAEIGRLVTDLGGEALTVSGLSGVGDIVLTCTGSLSRNRTVGLRIGQGEKVDDILKSMKMVAEGVRNSKSVCALARSAGTEMPIAEQIHLLLYDNKPADRVVEEFMSRQDKPEFS